MEGMITQEARRNLHNLLENAQRLKKVNEGKDTKCPRDRECEICMDDYQWATKFGMGEKTYQACRYFRMEETQ
ncbi:MAG: hypothetical protein OQK82_05615 [Candidatus Pacearchaeota archaeon]|nr:hypothetical protein [Candidatus Pacearchaeota archaeon]